jgi:hypothetical protein
LKTVRYLYIIGLVLVFSRLYVNAQIDYDTIRNTDTISYYVNNPHGNRAEFTWIIDGGIIVGHSSPYTEDGADTIQVIWNDSNKTSANYGSLKVSKIVKWPGGASCPSEETEINVESWVQPKAATDTAGIFVCSGESFVIPLDFEGKSPYQYKWKLFEKEHPGVLVEDHTAGFISSTGPSTNIIIAAIENNSNTEKLYEFEVTDIQDGLHDGMPCNVSLARVIIHVRPKPSAGILKSTNHLIRR